MLSKKINEITIIGPGLIGSSLGLALKKRGISKKIVGIGSSKKNAQQNAAAKLLKILNV